MNLDRKTLLALVAALAIGYFLARRAVPEPQPQDRPAIRWLARAAKNLLWIALVAEQPPEPTHHVVKARAVGSDGYPIVDNAEGW
jgi:hypothetical protein